MIQIIISAGKGDLGRNQDQACAIFQFSPDNASYGSDSNFVSGGCLAKGGGQSCKKAVSWYHGYRTFLEENSDIFKYLLYS